MVNACAIPTNKNVKCWGGNTFGQLDYFVNYEATNVLAIRQNINTTIKDILLQILQAVV